MIIETGKEYVEKNVPHKIAHVTAFSESGWSMPGIKEQYVHGYFVGRRKTGFKILLYRFLSNYKEINDVGN